MGAARLLIASILLVVPGARAPMAAPLLVQLEVSESLEESDFYDPSGFTVEVTAGHPVAFRVSVFDPVQPDQPVDVDDPSSHIEVRKAAGGGSRIRFADMERIRPGVYETAHTFEEAGLWVAVAQPDVDDRSALPSGSTDEVTFRVTAQLAAVGSWPPLFAMVASIVLVLLVGALVVLAGRSATKAPGEPPKEPVTHDTWWNSP